MWLSSYGLSNYDYDGDGDGSWASSFPSIVQQTSTQLSESRRRCSSCHRGVVDGSSYGPPVRSRLTDYKTDFDVDVVAVVDGEHDGYDDVVVDDVGCDRHLY